MTRLELGSWLMRVAVEAAPQEKRVLLLQALTPTRWSTPVAGWQVNGANVREVVNDRSLAEEAWASAYHNRLSLEPCEKLGDDGVLSQGAIALLAERPIVSLVAIDEDLIEVQIGGFELSQIYHRGNLMGLQRQVVESGGGAARNIDPVPAVEDVPGSGAGQPVKQRKLHLQSADVRRAERAGLPLPAAVIHMVGVPAAVDGTKAAAPPMLYPLRPAKNRVGRDELTGIVRAIMSMLALYAIIALRLLQAAGKSREDAVRLVESAAAQSAKRMEKIANKQLSSLTGLDDGAALASWAKQHSNALRIPDFLGAGRNRPLDELALDIVALLQSTLSKARAVLGAVHTTQLASDQDIGLALQRAFEARRRLTATDCYWVALFADINPAPLWRTHAHYADIYELARFVGCVDRGAKAVLVPSLFDGMQEALASDPADDAALAEMYKNLRLSIAAHFGTARLVGTIHEAREQNGVVVLDRKTRRLLCRTDVGVKTRVFGTRASK